MSARDNILNKLRQALPAGDDRGTAPQVQDYYAQVPANSSRPERVAQLRTLLEAAHADVIVAKPDDWAQLTAERLLAMGVHKLALNEEDRDSRALAAALQGRVTLTGFNRPIEAWKQELFDTVDAGFTVANSAIAATGTLVFKSAPELPRSLSLVPPLHVALVKAETIHAHLFAAALDEQWAAAMPTNLVMVSGPSKTSDIQQTLAYGAHGPKQMLVVIVEGDAP
jgi:L-lactate dehydrogenase complex protein LldG